MPSGDPGQPELEVTLMVSGPPLDEDMADAVRRAGEGVDGRCRPADVLVEPREYTGEGIPH